MVKITWPKPLLDDLCERKAIIVIGAGVSKRSVSSSEPKRHPPLWGEFLEKAVARYDIRKRHIRRAINEGDYLSACEWIRNIADEDWVRFLRDQFVAPSYKANDLHEKIFRLDQRITFSLNFDNIYETFVMNQTSGRTSVKQYYDDDVYKFLRDGGDYLIKMHGSIESPDLLIFSESDYAKARSKFANFYEVLDASILSHTFMFVGCGFKDPNIKLLLESHKFKFPQSMPHYILTGSRIPDDLEHTLLKTRNLKCIKYNTANNHEELLSNLDQLLVEMEQIRS